MTKVEYDTLLTLAAKWKKQGAYVSGTSYEDGVGDALTSVAEELEDVLDALKKVLA